MTVVKPLTLLLALLQTPQSIEGLWAYESISRAGGQNAQIAGLFCFRAGRFVQQSVNVGEPYERQLAQAHAGRYRFAGGKLRLLASEGLVVDPTKDPPIDSRDATEHEVAPRQSGDRLVLTFDTGTVQTFTRVGPARGDIILLDRGALALVDRRFVLVAEGPDHATSGSGSFERHGQRLRLHAERWLSIRTGRPRYSRDRIIDARLTSSMLTIPGEPAWPVIRATRRSRYGEH